MSNIAQVSVIGLGNWGTALAQHLSKKGIDVLGWSREENEVSSINDTGRHPLCLTDCALSFKATTDLEIALKASFILVALPSSVLCEYAPRLAECTHATIISAIKGFDPKTHLTPLSLIASYATNTLKLCVLSGPSFAADVVKGFPCSVVAGSSDLNVAESVAALFSNESMRVYSSSDPLGVELGGAVKNVIAVASGVSDGLSMGESARAALVTRGLAEMMRLAEMMGAKRETLSGLSGLGDLAMTASSMTSRNYRVGFGLGQGKDLHTIIREIGSVAEGVSSTPIVLSLSKKYGVEMPITEAVSKLISGELSPKDMARALMLRPQRQEF